MRRDTGENAQALRKILDMTRMMSLLVLALHYYFYCYHAFELWGWRSELSDRLLHHIFKTGLYQSFHNSKLIALGLLIVSLIGVKGKKSDKLGYRTGLAYLLSGLLIYFISLFMLYAPLQGMALAGLYMGCTSLGYILILTGGTLLTRIIRDKLKEDIFNLENETFPQEERLLESEFNINLKASYQLKKQRRNSYINVYPPRACIIAGTPGAGKTVFCVREFIIQALAKEEPYTLFVYDFKFPDLSMVAYNHWLKNKHRYKGKPGCYFINFDDLSRSNRCNVFNVMGMTDLTDATESSRTILLGLNREWERKTGDFFVESAVNFVTAIIWYLRKFENGTFCTLPHVIELMGVEYKKLFSILQLEPDISVLIDPFVKAFKNNVFPQLEGQIASAKIAMARLVSPQLYYVLSGNDFTLDLNNPTEPKLICMGNNPQKTQTYGAVLSTYVNRMLKIINQKGKEKSMLLFEEFPTLSADLIPTITTGRSNKIGTVLIIQDESQLRKDYGREKADVIMNTVGTIISGQVFGESAKNLSERIGRIMQDRQSLSINSGDTSISKNKQLEAAVPPSKIAGLSSGEFVGMVADTPSQPIQLKAFHCKIDADFQAIQAEEKFYKPIPIIRQVDTQMVQRNFLQIKKDIVMIVDSTLDKMESSPELEPLIIR